MLQSPATVAHGAKPLLRWAGSKRWLLPVIHGRYYSSSATTFYEPFAGSAAAFLTLDDSPHGIINDVIPEIINMYNAVRDSPDDVHEALSQWSPSETEYYRVRALKNLTPTEAAARTLYLNRQCFNGLYRTNRSGEFNVPYGRPKSDSMPTLDELKRAATRLNSATIECGDFQNAIRDADSSSFIFFDPPYTQEATTRRFYQYNHQTFTWKEQRRLRDVCATLRQREIPFIVTLPDSEDYRALYEGFKYESYSRYSSISGAVARRRQISELVISS
jgi:DNA adenine methylase